MPTSHRAVKAKRRAGVRILTHSDDDSSRPLAEASAMDLVMTGELLIVFEVVEVARVLKHHSGHQIFRVDIIK